MESSHPNLQNVCVRAIRHSHDVQIMFARRNQRSTGRARLSHRLGLARPRGRARLSHREFGNVYKILGSRACHLKNLKNGLPSRRHTPYWSHKKKAHSRPYCDRNRSKRIVFQWENVPFWGSRPMASKRVRLLLMGPVGRVPT